MTIQTTIISSALTKQKKRKEAQLLAKGKWILIYDNGYRYLVSIAGDHYEKLEIVSVISENKGIARDINTGKYYEYDNESGSLFLKESSIPSD